MEYNENINKDQVDNSANGMKINELKEAMPKAQDVQLVGKFLKDKYYPGLSVDEIGERLDMLIDQGLTVDEIVNQIEYGEIDLAAPIEELNIVKDNEEKKQDDGPSLD